MEAAAEFHDPHDGWLIARLRALPRRRLEDLLLDRRLRHLDVGRLVDHLERLEAEIAMLRAQMNATDERPSGHVLFLPTPGGYAIIEADEQPPPTGQLLFLNDGCFRVQRVGRSPFPLDRRPCLFLEAETSEPNRRAR
jgi:hypothetical protein